MFFFRSHNGLLPEPNVRWVALSKTQIQSPVPKKGRHKNALAFLGAGFFHLLNLSPGIRDQGTRLFVRQTYCVLPQFRNGVRGLR